MSLFLLKLRISAVVVSFLKPALTAKASAENSFWRDIQLMNSLMGTSTDRMYNRANKSNVMKYDSICILNAARNCLLSMHGIIIIPKTPM